MIITQRPPRADLTFEQMIHYYGLTPDRPYNPADAVAPGTGLIVGTVYRILEVFFQSGLYTTTQKIHYIESLLHHLKLNVDTMALYDGRDWFRIDAGDRERDTFIKWFEELLEVCKKEQVSEAAN